MRRRSGHPQTSRQDQGDASTRAFEPSRPAHPSPLAASTIRGIPLDIVDRIRSFSFFSSAPEEFLIAIGSCLRLQIFSAQESILNEGDEAKAMYWLIRGAVMVTSRDRESIYAELLPGSFFGEIGILMNVPRTASIVARHKSLVVRLNAEDLQKELPKYPDVDRAIREEAAERLAILERQKTKKQNRDLPPTEERPNIPPRRRSKRPHDEVNDGEVDTDPESERVTMQARRGSSKKLKSPPPSVIDTSNTTSALNTGSIQIRGLLKQLPLFSKLPDEFLHFLGLNAEPLTFPPFTLILKQRTKGRDVFFMADGVVEVFTEDPDGLPGGHHVRARLKSGQYFGEVTSLSLAPERTASVRTVTSVECLVIRGDVIEELWRRCPVDLRAEVEATARQRLRDNADFGRIEMDIDEALPDISDTDEVPSNASSSPVSFQDISYQNSTRLSLSAPEPFDPDPFFNAERTTRRPGTSRRGSLANLPAEASPLAQSSTEDEEEESPKFTSMVIDSMPPPVRPRMASNQEDPSGKGIFPDPVLTRIFQHLDLYQLMRLRVVSKHWSRLLSRSPDLLDHLNLSSYNRFMTDEVVSNIIAPFVGQRPRSINISNCFHMSDEGFSELVARCGENVTHWRMKSVWDISPTAIVQMANKAQHLESVDFSNCRKVSDNLLSRIVGWIVRRPSQQQVVLVQPHPDNSEVAVVGCPRLTRLTLSYCKHVSDRFMQHVAHHAADRLEQINLTRCTTISDMGFRHWSERSFPRLRQLTLADCTYLSDVAISYLTQAARNLEELDLSFCCALSDASVDRISATLRHLRVLNLAFCGSAVSDASMGTIGHGLKNLRELSVRGCVRVTRVGVEAVVSGCRELEQFDVSQCRNLYLAEEYMNGRVKFSTVADGQWRVGD